MPGSFRPEILEILQLGLEDMYATPVSANRRLPSVKVDLDAVVPVTEVMASGSKSPVGAVVGKEHTKIPFTGEGALNDLGFLFGMLLETPTISGVGSLTKLWEYMPDTHQADSFSSFTLEKGSALGAARVAGVLCDALELSFLPEKSVSFKGDLFGKQRIGNISMTAGPTQIPLVPMGATGIGIYLADNEADLASGKIKPLEAAWSVKDRQGMPFTLDPDEPSFDDTVEKALKPKGQITVRANSTSEGYLNDLRSATQRFIQYVWTGALIETDLNYKLEITMPFHFENPKEGPKQDAHTHTFDLCGEDNDTFGSSCRVRIYTTMTGL